jgi:hypothetical protein
MPRKPIVQHADESTDHWKKVESGIKDVVNQRPSSLSLSTLHAAVGAIVASGNSDCLRSGLYVILADHFKTWRHTLSQRAEGPLLGAFSEMYCQLEALCRIIPKFYMLFDSKNPHICPRLGSTCFLIRSWFSEIVLTDDSLVVATTDGIRRNIATARSRTPLGNLVHESQLMQLFCSFRDYPPQLPIFENFISELAKDTQAFCQDFFRTHFYGTTFPLYLQFASEQFAREEALLRDLFKELKPEQEKILSILHEVLLLQQEDKFLNGPHPLIATALTSSDNSCLKWLVQTYERFKIHPVNVYATCANYIHDEMAKRVVDFKPDMKVADIAQRVAELISATMILSEPYERAFCKVPNAIVVLEERIQEAWNNPEFDIVTNFCAFIDYQIKSEFRSLSEQERADFPAIVARFYSRTEDKKAFGELYTVGMTRRVIRMPHKLPELEFPIISAIRRARAPDFGKAWPDFMKKVKESEVLETAFREAFPKSAADPRLTKISFAPLVFDQRTFPLEKNEARNIPEDLAELHRFFKQQYEGQFPRRKLMLLCDVSNVECKFAVPKNAKAQNLRTYTVTSDITCAAILLVIAERIDGITLREIVERVGDRNSVGQYLVRLCQPGCPIVKRSGKEKRMNDDDLFQFNPQFFFNAMKVAVQPIVSERKVDVKKTAEKVEMDKTQAIKASAVRVLKMKNKVEQSQLESDVIQAMAQYFRADIAMIRRELLDLEAADYLERETVDGKTILTYRQ